MMTTAVCAMKSSPWGYEVLLRLLGAGVELQNPFFINSSFLLSLVQCKHILAVYLSQAMGATQQEAVSDRQMSTLLSGTEAT